MAEILFAPDGSARFVHDDDVAEVMAEVGALTVRRASHVEPDGEGKWYADLSPVGGPMLAGFDRRGQALAAEHAWLIEHDVPSPRP